MASPWRWPTKAWRWTCDGRPAMSDDFVDQRKGERRAHNDTERRLDFQRRLQAITTRIHATANLDQIMLDLVRLAEDFPLPFARLLQEMAPGDGRILRALEPGTVDGFRHRLVDIANQSVGDGKPRQHGDIALRDGEGHVGAGRVAPLGNQAAAPEDQAGRTAALPDRADDLAPGA